jgi:Arc/MetJ family transcription regulator
VDRPTGWPDAALIECAFSLSPTDPAAGRARHGFDVKRLEDNSLDLMGSTMSFSSGFVYTGQRRTTIVSDDELMPATLRETGLTTEREAVEAGLRALLCLTRQSRVRRLRGKLH